MNWFRLGAAAVLPAFVVLPVALLLWKKQQPIVGNAEVVPGNEPAVPNQRSQ